jgi:SHS2 domain-containing protein
MMEPFHFLDHPADVGFEAWGITREEAFENAARALVSLRVNLDSVAPLESRTVQVQGSDWLSLLVNWLSEILYLQDAERWLPCDFKFTDLRETGLTAMVQGEKFNPSKHHLKSLVKAITYHQLAFEKQGDLWRARVFVDV